MILADGSPLQFGPRSVARMLENLRLGWSCLEGACPLEVHPASPGSSPRRMRAALPKLAAEHGARGFFSPWSAHPDLSALGIPIVAVVHELPFVRLGPIEGRVRAWKHRRWLRRNVRGCAAIVVPTEATRADLLTLHPDAEPRVHVVPHGFEPSFWSGARAFGESGPYAVMVGVGANARMARKKGLDVALAAWRQGLVPKDLRLVLAGAPALPLVGGVEARPDLDDERLRVLVAGARMLIYPSRSEGFGFPPLEALAAGVPVVASDVPAIAEITAEGALLVPPGDPEALGAAVHRLHEDETARAACLAAGAVRVEAFTPQRAAEGIRDVFRSVGVDA